VLEKQIQEEKVARGKKHLEMQSATEAASIVPPSASKVPPSTQIAHVCLGDLDLAVVGLFLQWHMTCWPGTGARRIQKASLGEVFRNFPLMLSRIRTSSN